MILYIIDLLDAITPCGLAVQLGLIYLLYKYLTLECDDGQVPFKFCLFF